MQAVGLAQTQNHFIVLTGLFSNTVTYLFRYSAGQTWVSHRAVHTRELMILRFMQTGLTHGMRIKISFFRFKKQLLCFSKQHQSIYARCRLRGSFVVQRTRKQTFSGFFTPAHLQLHELHPYWSASKKIPNVHKTAACWWFSQGK